MGLTDEEIKEIRKEFDNSCRPVILFDDDPDGLCSFLLVYKHINDGKGMPIKSSEVGPDFAERVNEFGPDLIIILDKPLVSQEFLDHVKAKVIWIDHHPVQDRKKVHYYNPRIHDDSDNRPTSYWVYRILEENIWIGMVGMVGDWFLPEREILDKFCDEYPELLPRDISRPEVALHETALGKLARIFAFNLKGMTSDVIKSVKVFSRIESPAEILGQTTPKGRFVYKKYDKLNTMYENLLKKVKVAKEDKIVLFAYQTDDYSFSATLSNELVYRHPDKLIIVAWEYNGEYKCSMRSTKYNLPELIEKALDGVEGYGGGHDAAAGACIKSRDFMRFVNNIRNILD